jgi:hypothetical protein
MINNAGITNSRIKFCDLKCEYAQFPEKEALDGAKSCHTFMALWCKQLEKYVTKNAPCEVQYGARRPKSKF